MGCNKMEYEVGKQFEIIDSVLKDIDKRLKVLEDKAGIKNETV